MANFDDEDDFDFGGDDGDDQNRGMSHGGYDEIDEEDDDLFAPAPKIQSGVTETVDAHATTTIINLRASLEEKEKRIESLEAQLSNVTGELDRWRSAFRTDAILPATAGDDVVPDPTMAYQTVLKLQTSESRLREQTRAAKRRENGMLWKLTNKEQEIVELKTMVHDLQALTRPSMLQDRKLLLDPAVHAEFLRLKGELESSEKKVKELQDDLSAVAFTPHSRNGKLLMAKCRILQEENEEIGREHQEGKAHTLENKIGLQKQLITELQKGYQDFQEFVEDLNEENERLQQTVFALQRQLQGRDRDFGDKGPPRNMRYPREMRDMDRKGMKRMSDFDRGRENVMDMRDRRDPRRGRDMGRDRDRDRDHT